jgi:hypothetical protein
MYISKKNNNVSRWAEFWMKSMQAERSNDLREE